MIEDTDISIEIEQSGIRAHGSGEGEVKVGRPTSGIVSESEETDPEDDWITLYFNVEEPVDWSSPTAYGTLHFSRRQARELRDELTEAVETEGEPLFVKDEA